MSTNNLSISLFKGYADTCPTEVELKTVVEMIRSDSLVTRSTELHRSYLAQGRDKAASREKSATPCFAVAVCFSGGKRKENVSGWTSLCLADFDHIEPGQMERCLGLIREDSHTLLAYVTISGTGIRVISTYAPGKRCAICTPQALYRLAFEQMNAYYQALTGLAYDEKCKNATRLSGLAHDPDVYYHPEAVPFVVDKAEEQVRYLLNAYGVDQDLATEWAVKRFADYDGDVEGIVRSCYRQVDEYGKLQLPSKSKSDDKENYFASATEIESFLASKGSYRLNTVTGKCEFAPAGGEDFTDLTDRHVSTLWAQMDKEVKPLRISDLRTVLQSEFVPLYNPFRQYFDGLRPWDGVTDHIGLLAARVHVSHGADLFPRCFKKWLVAMVASLLDAEVVNHQILVLIGRQGIYKTTWLNNLLPPELRRYFYLKSNSRHINKDDLLTLSEFAIVCLEELDELDGRELNQLKALTTMRSINERAAYAHYKEVRTHIASYCGTGNNIHFLTDLTGNRRWMPFEVEGIDNPYTHPLDYKAIYAQAYALVQQGFAYWLDDEELRRLNEHNRYFEVPCLERELILTYYQRPMEGEECVFLTCAQILTRLNAGLRHTLSATKVGTVMKQEGFQPMRVGGKRGYRVVELSGEEIEFRKRSVTHWA